MNKANSSIGPTRPKRRGTPRANNNPERFWGRVRKGDGCWLWTGGEGGGGYGSYSVRGRSVQAHRVAYEMAVGPIPPGLSLLHSCDTPRCVNPAHLRPGTQLDNMRDKVARGRQWRARGSLSGNSRLTEETVLAIRRLHAEGAMSDRAIARLYGVAQMTVCFIVNRKTWTHI